MPSHSVLLVEDSEFITEHVSTALESAHGFDVDAVTTGEATRATLADEAQSFDCIVSSYELPDETGIDLAASLEEESVPFVLFTGNPLEPLVDEALSAGVSAFVSKSTHATGEMNVFANRIRLAIEAHGN
ncbi:receiver box response regulator [Natrialba magadii ATCC 43099]|uniref:Receiver box response regulator n=1 Tax=Natrialba magadii (strain ATCC 43099 / DSM 3394 / CCM 3739 / CIP 104546 / IAM 13178 / JCM 8861 / NBRC 102185 / NCIMB 2190 / MS3) TaxID=547559 RepID=D3ST72_NATMM|nr:response regulator [Natrialba magadii]ADD06939.1 receiver box response regulator [Natrialba magadii ATCC 43099]ELY28437.1 response regulator receiver protein [Natrialba magadii ATCC 43099]